MSSSEKSFEDILNEVNASFAPPPREDNPFQEFEEHTLSDAEDSQILMHRDTHFSGNFPLMIEYYLRDSKGTQKEFTAERLIYLHDVEKHTGENLAPTLLSGADMETVAHARETYKRLRELYESEVETKSNSHLIADMILSEEEMPQKEIDAIVERGSKIVPSLLRLVTTEYFLNPLYPGYGFAPMHAAICLGMIGDPRAIQPLFESLGHLDFFAEEHVIDALKLLGKPSLDFLIDVLASTPVTQDNEKAAMALMAFKEDPRVAETALELLEKEIAGSDETLSTYLVLLCESLSDSSDQARFRALVEEQKIPAFAKEDANLIMKNW